MAFTNCGLQCHLLSVPLLRSRQVFKVIEKGYSGLCRKPGFVPEGEKFKTESCVLGSDCLWPYIFIS